MVITKITEKVLALFVSNPTKTYTIREVSLHTKINYRQIYQEVMCLKEQEVLTIEKKGSSNVCSINLSKHASLYAYIESIRAGYFLKAHAPFRVILQELKSLPTQYYSLILFGSWAKGTVHKNSDIDLLFIIPTESMVESFEREIHARLRQLQYHFDINVITEESFKEMGGMRTLNLRAEVIQNHLVLKGAEEYYHLLTI